MTAKRTSFFSHFHFPSRFPLRLLCLTCFYVIVCHVTLSLCQYGFSNYDPPGTYYLYNPNAYHQDINDLPEYRDQRKRLQQQPKYMQYQEYSPYAFQSPYPSNGFENNFLGYAKPRFGQPLPSHSYEDPTHQWGLTPEERESKRQNPLPYIINPLIRRSTSTLGHLEAFGEKGGPVRAQSLKPLLNLVLNPSKRR